MFASECLRRFWRCVQHREPRKLRCERSPTVISSRAHARVRWTAVAGRSSRAFQRQTSEEHVPRILLPSQRVGNDHRALAARHDEKL